MAREQEKEDGGGGKPKIPFWDKQDEKNVYRAKNECKKRRESSLMGMMRNDKGGLYSC